MRHVATGSITLAIIGIFAVGLNYPSIGQAIAYVLMILLLWGTVDAMVGHHFGDR